MTEVRLGWEVTDRRRYEDSMRLLGEAVFAAVKAQEAASDRDG